MGQFVRVTSGSRLHLGLIACQSNQGRQFGGVGLMIDEPQVVVTAKRASFDSLHGTPHECRRIAEFCRAFRSAREAASSISCAIAAERSIPPHVGLGGGTQLGLAVSTCLSHLAGLQQPIVDRARDVGRGLRSAVGLYGFESGGLILEGGKRDKRISPLISRIAVPAEWRFLLARPRSASGIHSDEEVSAFRSLPAMESTRTAELCRVAVTRLLPAFAEADFDEAGEAIYDYGQLVGEFFSSAQAGVFANLQMGRLAAHLRSAGIPGVGQSSWGPTVFALVESAAVGQSVLADLHRSGDWADCELRCVRARNAGATIEFCPSTET